MGSIGRYIFRSTFSAFLMVLISVTTLMWMTQALRNFDLMTSQGQSILVFVGITGLIIPLLVLMIAPIALMIAVSHVLNRLSTDSELIVMNAAGMAPRQIFMPFLAVGMIVSLALAVISIYLSPKCLRELRRWATEVRAEVVSSNVQPGKFNSLEGGKLTFHVRERRANGQLAGILLDDQRDPKEQTTILAERGDIVTNEQGVYLVLQDGTVQRREKDKRDPALVKFDQYAFDLSRLSAAPGKIRYSVQERYLWELMDPPPDDSLYNEQPSQFTTEIHNRLTAPLYPLAFLVLTFAYLGAPRTTRQSRTMSFISVILVVSVVRGAGFVGTLSGSKDAYSFAIPYLALLGAFVFGSWGIARGLIIEPPAFFATFYTWLTESMSFKKPVATGPTQ